MYEDLFAGLERAGVRYLVVGGVAVVLHGFLRATGDLDLVVQLEETNLRAFLALMKERGYRPRPPVPIEDFADPVQRRSWIEEKGMLVFTLFHPQRLEENIDVFVEEPFPFAPAYVRRVLVPAAGSSISLASIPDLIGLKERAGRPQDLEDIRALREIEQGGGRGA